MPFVNSIFACVHLAQLFRHESCGIHVLQEKVTESDLTISQDGSTGKGCVKLGTSIRLQNWKQRTRLTQWSPEGPSILAENAKCEGCSLYSLKGLGAAQHKLLLHVPAVISLSVGIALAQPATSYFLRTSSHPSHEAGGCWIYIGSFRLHNQERRFQGALRNSTKRY